MPVAASINVKNAAPLPSYPIYLSIASGLPCNGEKKKLTSCLSREALKSDDWDDAIFS